MTRHPLDLLSLLLGAQLVAAGVAVATGFVLPLEDPSRLVVWAIGILAAEFLVFVLFTVVRRSRRRPDLPTSEPLDETAAT